jgi:hypothetical protein
MYQIIKEGNVGWDKVETLILNYRKKVESEAEVK